MKASVRRDAQRTADKYAGPNPLAMDSAASSAPHAIALTASLCYVPD